MLLCLGVLFDGVGNVFVILLIIFQNIRFWGGEKS